MGNKRIPAMRELVMDVAGMKGNYQPFNEMSYMASALMIAAKGTRHEIDARMLIEQIYPQFFWNDTTEQTDERTD